MANSQGLIIGFALFVIGIFVSVVIQNYFSDFLPWGSDSESVALTILLLMPLGFSITFFLFLIVRFVSIRETMKEYFYTIPEKMIRNAAHNDIHSSKVLFQYILLSIIISFLTILVLLSYPIEQLSDLIPVISDIMNTEEIVEDIKESFVKQSGIVEDNYTASDLFISIFGFWAFILMAIGSFWFFVIR